MNKAQQLAEKCFDKSDAIAEDQVKTIIFWFEELANNGVSSLEINHNLKAKKGVCSYWMPYSDKTIRLLEEQGFVVEKEGYRIIVYLPTKEDKCEEKKISEEDRTHQSKPQSISLLQNDAHNSNILYHLYRIAALEGIYLAVLVWIFNPGP